MKKTKLEGITVYVEPTREGVWATFHRRYKEPDMRGLRKAIDIKVKIDSFEPAKPGVTQWGPKGFDMEMNNENADDAIEFVRRYHKIKNILFGDGNGDSPSSSV